MGDNIDRSKWTEEDHLAERRGREWAEFASDGSVAPPPPDAVTPPPKTDSAPGGGSGQMTGLGVLQRIFLFIRPFGRGHGLWVRLLALFAVLLVISGGIWISTRDGGDPTAGSAGLPTAGQDPVVEASAVVDPPEPAPAANLPSPDTFATEDPDGPVEDPVDNEEADPASPAGDGGGEALISSAAGTYRLVEGTARQALEPVVWEFEFADGVLVIEPDGSISGEITYRYSSLMGDDLIADVVYEGTLPGTTLEPADDGFVFRGTVVIRLQVTPQVTGPEIPPPFSTDTTAEVIGVVDLELSTIGLSQVGEGDNPRVVIFQR